MFLNGERDLDPRGQWSLPERYTAPGYQPFRFGAKPALVANAGDAQWPTPNYMGAVGRAGLDAGNLMIGDDSGMDLGGFLGGHPARFWNTQDYYTPDFAPKDYQYPAYQNLWKEQGLGDGSPVAMNSLAGMTKVADASGALPNMAARGPTAGINGHLKALIARAQEISPVPFGVYPSGGARTKAEQTALVKAGWTKTMRGAHLSGDAIDLIPIVDGKPDPNSKAGYGLIHEAMMQASQELGIPIKAGADYKGSFKDPPHYELANPMDAAYVAGQEPSARGQGSGDPISIPFSDAEKYELGQAGYPGVTAPSKEALFSSLESQYGLPSGTLGGFYGIESNFGANAGVSSAGARGPFQFIPGTAKQYGLNNRDSLAASAEATAKYAADNMAGLKQALGRDPTAGELYLAHQQGLAGAISLLSNPDQPATSIVGRAAIAQNLPAGMSADGMTAGDFANFWNGQFQTKSMAFAGTPPPSPIDAAFRPPGDALAFRGNGDAIPPSAPPIASMATTPPPVATGNAAVDRVVRATQDSDPAGITSGWNNLISSVMTGGVAAKNAVMDAFGRVPDETRMSSAANFAFQPKLWQAVPESAGPFGIAPLRAPLQAASEDQLTAHHAVDTLNRFGIGPSQVGPSMATAPPIETAASRPAATRALTYADDTPAVRTPDTAITPSSQGEVPTSVTWPSMAAATGKDPLQAVTDATKPAASMATSPPPSPDEPQLPTWAAGGIAMPPVIGPPDTGEVAPSPPADVGVPPPPHAAPAPSPMPVKSATGSPSFSGIGGRIYNAIAAPISSGSANFWSGPMISPNFSSGSGGSIFSYQPNTGRTTTDVHANTVNVGVYTDEHGTQHEYTWSANGAP